MSGDSDVHLKAGYSVHGSEIGEVALLHRLLKLNNRLMAPFSTHLSHRYNISLNEFRLLMAIGALGAPPATSWPSRPASTR